MRISILTCFLFILFNSHAQEAFPPVSFQVDSLLNIAYNARQQKDTIETETAVRSVQTYLDHVTDEYRPYKGIIHLFQAFYTFDQVKRENYQRNAFRLLRGSGRFLPDNFSLALYNLQQLHYSSRRMPEWLSADTLLRREISPDKIHYSVMDYADEKIRKKEYATGKILAMYDYYIFMYHNSNKPMDRLGLMYNDWLVFKADLEQWLQLPFDFRYPEEFSKQSVEVSLYKTRYSAEQYELRDKNYKKVFAELLSRIKELQKVTILENGYEKPGTDRLLRQAYYHIYLSIINGYYSWAIHEQKEGQVILPLKQFINQDLIPNELEKAFVYKQKPVINGVEFLTLVRNLANLYHQTANGIDERETIFTGYEYLVNKKIFDVADEDRALIMLLKDRVRAERLLRNYDASLKASRSTKIFAALPDSKNKNLERWDNYMDARVEEIYTLMESGQQDRAIDSLALLMNAIAPLDDGTDKAPIYTSRSWPHIQYLVATIKAGEGNWMTDLLKESLSDIEKQSPLPEIYYPVQLFYLKAFYRKEGKFNEDVLSNLLIYTGRQLKYTFMMLTAEERMNLFEKKLSGYFDVYHELLFQGMLDTHPSLKERVIAQSLSLKNSLADGNLIPDQLFLDKKGKISASFIGQIRQLRQEINLNLLRSGMRTNYVPESGKLKDRVQDMWLGLLEDAGMDSLVQHTEWKKISARLKPGEVFTETVRYRKWLTDSTAHYGAYVVHPGGKIRIVNLYAEERLEKLLKDPSASPQTSALNPEGNRGGQVINEAAETTKTFTKGSIDRLGKFLLQPLWPYIANQKKWLFVQDGLLNRIAFAALQWNGKDLFHYLQLNQLSGSASLNLPPVKLPSGANVLLAGGLTYGSSVKEGGSQLFKPGYTWNYLPGTKLEIEKLRVLFRAAGNKVKVYSGEQLPDSLISVLPGHQLVHLATHGFYFDSSTASRIYHDQWNRQSMQHEPLYRNGIVVSNANEPVNGDGYFLGYELANTDLRKCYLVTLSACETGLGDVRNNLGVDGLSRALKIGGARHLLISLWKVPDQPTAVFMEQFYKHLLKGVMPAEALRLTQIFMSRNYSAKDWAAFVLVE